MSLLKKVVALFFLSSLLVSAAFGETVKILKREYDVETTTKLTLTKSKLTAIPRAVFKLKNLEEINFANNEISDIKDILSLPKLRVIKFEDNHIVEIPTAIGNLASLEHVNFSNNRIRSVPPSMTLLANLIELNMHNNQVEFIPEHFRNSAGANFKGNPKPLTIGGIPFSRYTKVLDLSEQNLQRIPDAVFHMAELEELNLANNMLEAIDGIERLKRLRTLNITNNAIKNLPAELTTLPVLSVLEAGKNLISDLPENMNMLRSLTSITMANNKFTVIPDAFFNARSLVFADWSSNEIAEIPENIGALTHLRTLLLNKNNISELPEALAQLEELQRLELKSNQLTAVPEFIGAMPKLTRLRLEENVIDTPPASLGKIRNLILSISTQGAMLDEFKPWLEILLPRSSNNTLYVFDEYCSQSRRVPVLAQGDINEEHELYKDASKFAGELIYKASANSSATKKGKSERAGTKKGRGKRK